MESKLSKKMQEKTYYGVKNYSITVYCASIMSKKLLTSLLNTFLYTLHFLKPCGIQNQLYHIPTNTIRKSKTKERKGDCVFKHEQHCTRTAKLLEG
jgi:hypothetical protein